MQTIIHISESLIDLLSGGETPDPLSAEDTLKLLRWLSNLQGSEDEGGNWLARGLIEEQEAKAEIARQLLVAALVEGKRQEKAVGPSLGEDAAEAAGALAMSVIEHALSLLPDNHPDRERLEAKLPNIPKRVRLRQAQSVDRLLSLVARAFERPAPERLAGISASLRKSTQQLYSIDTLKPPAREESIELAREILRRLRNMRGVDDAPAAGLGVGDAEEKTTLAQKLEDMLEIYKNLLLEAAETNPGIMNDPRIREATEAAGNFAYAISLLAAKEMPNSLAAAQQISADIAHMPEEWKKLDGRTVGRLVKSMEGGVERAAQEIEAQQQETQKQADLSPEAVEFMRQQQQMFQPRKRRRRSSSSGLTKFAKRRSAHDLNGDGVDDALQGLGLKQGDMIAVRQLGESLRAVSQAAAKATAAAAASITAFSALDKPRPDDKGFTDRKNDERDKNPRNQRPGV